MRRSLVAALLTAAALGGCGDHRRVEPAAVDAGALRNGAPAAAPPRAPITLADGTRVMGTPTAQRLSTYLDSPGQPGWIFQLRVISFVNGVEVREDRDGSIATLAAILRQHPTARVRIEVALLNPGEPGPGGAAQIRAEAVAAAFRRNGVPAGQISAAGVKGADEIPNVQLVVLAK